MFVELNDLKNHINIDQSEFDFDADLTMTLKSAQRQVVAYVNRNVFETLPDPAEDNDILVDDSIKYAILELAGYMFDNKGAIDSDIVSSILDMTVGHLRIIEI